MAFTNATVTSITDFATKLNTWMSSNGWTAEHIDVTTTAGTGGEWAMRRTAGATNIRFAASWDGAGTPTYMALYQYVGHNYVIGDRPWGQDDDSGNGLAATTPDADLANERHVLLTATPIQYWAFEDDDYTHIVVETTAGNYVHFGFGILLKYGDWTGGEYCYGQRNNLTVAAGGSIAIDGVSYGLDGHFNDTADTGGPDGSSTFAYLMAATIHAEGLPSQVANGQWAVCMGGIAASPQTVFGNDRQSNDGASSDTARALFTDGLRQGGPIDGFARASGGADVSGYVAMWEIAPRYIETLDSYGPMGRQPDVRGINMSIWTAGDTVVQGGDTWVLFPAQVRYPGSGSGSSGFLGLAYKQVA